jgi:enoyl-CoA hydratase/carnithine racemase
MSDEVLTEERDGVLVVLLNRPGGRNAVEGASAFAEKRAPVRQGR